MEVLCHCNKAVSGVSGTSGVFDSSDVNKRSLRHLEPI